MLYIYLLLMKIVEMSRFLKYFQIFDPDYKITPITMKFSYF